MSDPVAPGVVAEWLNLSTRRVNQLAKDGTLPRVAEGRYDLMGCVLAYIRFLQSGGEEGGADAELAQIRLERQRVALKRDELDLHRDAGALVTVTDAARYVGAIMDAIATALQVAPRKYGVDPEDRARLKLVCIDVANALIDASAAAVQALPIPEPMGDGAQLMAGAPDDDPADA